MRTVGIKLLKNRLSEYVRAAEAGETVLVTDRARVVAELTPHRRRREQSVAEILADGVREGWYTPAELSWTDSIPEGEASIPFDQLMSDLAASREDR